MSKPVDVPFECTCGQVHGHIKQVAPNRGNHLICYCKSCQTAANVLSQTHRLTTQGGTQVYQTVPSRVVFAAGVQNLACLRLSPKGLLRFYASCCDAPLFNMPNQPRFAFASLNLDRVAPDHLAPFGDIRGAHATRDAVGGAGSLRDFGLKRAALGVAARAIMALLRRDSNEPFFDNSGAIAAPVRVLSLEERRAHTPD